MRRKMNYINTLVNTLVLYAPSFYRSRFEYGVRSLNTRPFHSYCSSKNVLFMGQNDLDPRTLDLHLNVNLAIEIFYQYEYAAKVEILNYGAITACLRKGSAFRYKIKWEQEQGFNGNDVT